MARCLPRIVFSLLLLLSIATASLPRAKAQSGELAYDPATVMAALFDYPLPAGDIFWQGSFEEEVPDDSKVVRQAQIRTYPGIITYRVYENSQTAENSVHATIGLRVPIDDFVQNLLPADLTDVQTYDDLVAARPEAMLGRNLIVFDSADASSVCVLELNVVVCGFSVDSWDYESDGAAIMSAIVGLALLMEVVGPQPLLDQASTVAGEPSRSDESPGSDGSSTRTPMPAQEEPASTLELEARPDLAPIQDRIIPAAVQIAIVVDASVIGIPELVTLPVGSGTVVSASGLILTNWHVVDLGEHRRELAANGMHLADESLIVLTSDGENPPRPNYLASVVAHDELLDLASQVLEVL